MSDRPNILVIMSDQHNVKITGCYGDDLVRTPNIDRLAAEGMRMDRCYTASPICVPARMSFMSGRRPSENNVTDNCDILSSAILTWPERLHTAGYHTALIGRMHFEGPDQWHGFETTLEELRHWRGNRPVRNQEETERVPNGSYWSPRTSIEQLSGAGRTFVQFRDEVVCQKGREFLRQQVGAERPFAAVIGLYNPHPPYVGRRDLFDYYYDRVSVPEDTLGLMPDYLGEFYSTFRDWENPRAIDAQDKRRARAAYYSNVEHVDEQVGQILRVLEETALLDDTLVLYTTDHGDMLGRLGAWGKCTFYDDAARIPMIARLPGVVPAGSASRHNCNLRDLGNTFCEIAGAAKLAGSDAVSMWTTLRGGEAQAPNCTESEVVLTRSCFGGVEDVPCKMYCEGPWKLWRYDIGDEHHCSLFNLDEDPDELRDRIDEPALAGLVSTMKARLMQHWDPAHERAAHIARKSDRVELDKAWHKTWQHAGYPVPADLDADVDTPHTRSL
jgi:choline-sulfatase